MALTRRHFLRDLALGTTAIQLATAGTASAARSQGDAPTKGRSIHLGLNSVDPSRYSGWSGRLRGCENDAHDMARIATKAGFNPVVELITKQATRDALMTALTEAAKWSQDNPGSIILLTNSSHGGYIPDPLRIKPSGMSDTWCLYDGQVIDHELYNAWGPFVTGTRILVFSDSCHSGTVVRDIIASRDAFRPMATNFAAKGSGLDVTNSFTDVRDVLAEAAGLQMPRDVAMDNPEEPFSYTRGVPPKIQEKILKDHPDLGKREKVAATTRKENQQNADKRKENVVQSSVLLISGCQDTETSGDGPKNGLFTAALKAVWNDGSFKGTYRSFRDAIVWQLKYDDQHPNYYTTGVPNTVFETQRPFTI